MMRAVLAASLVATSAALVGVSGSQQHLVVQARPTSAPILPSGWSGGRRPPERSLLTRLTSAILPGCRIEKRPEGAAAPAELPEQPELSPPDRRYQSCLKLESQIVGVAFGD